MSTAITDRRNELENVRHDKNENRDKGLPKDRIGGDALEIAEPDEFLGVAPAPIEKTVVEGARRGEIREGQDRREGGHDKQVEPPFPEGFMGRDILRHQL